MLNSNINKLGKLVNAAPLPLGLLVSVLLASPAPASAEEFFGTRELLREQFAQSERVSYVQVQPNSALRARIEQRLGRRLAKSSYTFFVATTGGKVDGYALFDEERGQHEPISFATFFDQRGHITRVEVVAYREPYGDGIRAERFRRQFVGRSADSGFTPNKDIDAISGATISSRSLCAGVRRASVLLEEAVLGQKAVLAAR